MDADLSIGMCLSKLGLHLVVGRLFREMIAIRDNLYKFINETVEIRFVLGKPYCDLQMFFGRFQLNVLD